MQNLKKYLLLLLVMPTLSFGQENNEELIEWKASSRLAWTDYKGKPDPASDAAASTTTYLGIEYDINDKGFSYKIQCRFSRTKSWGLSKTEYILKHEQGHFDIAEIFARELNKKMGEYKFDKSTYRKDLRKIYEEVTSDKASFQDEYDTETDHSRKKEQQGEWEKKIEKKLKDLQPYADYN